MMEGLAATGVEPQTVMIDATYLKAHRTASNLRVKKGSWAFDRPRQRRHEHHALCRRRCERAPLALLHVNQPYVDQLRWLPFGFMLGEHPAALMSRDWRRRAGYNGDSRGTSPRTTAAVIHLTTIGMRVHGFWWNGKALRSGYDRLGDLLLSI